MLFQMYLEKSEESRIIFLPEAKNVSAKTDPFQSSLIYFWFRLCTGTEISHEN